MKEIISKLEVVKEWVGDISLTRQDAQQAIDEAIKALEENQQYRAIGTVKEIKIREAQFARLSEGYLNDLTSLREYQAIGTIEEFKALKEKSIAKKPIEKERNRLNVWDCPTCNNELYSGQHYCDECGQAIIDDWE